MAVIDILHVVNHATFDRKYEGIVRIPRSEPRYFPSVVPKDIMVGQIELMIACRGKIWENYELFDIYEGSQIQEGYKSVAYSITFRSKEKTLEEAEVSSAMKKILNGLKVRIQLRQ